MEYCIPQARRLVAEIALVAGTALVGASVIVINLTGM